MANISELRKLAKEVTDKGYKVKISDINFLKYKKRWEEDENTLLYILISKEEDVVAKISVFIKIEGLEARYGQVEMDIHEIDLREISTCNTTLKEGLGNNFNHPIREIHIEFFNEIDRAIQAKRKLPGGDEARDVWIYCEVADIDPIWEWIYSEGGGFFWGDEFHIVRIEKRCDISDRQVNTKVIILADNSSKGALWNCALDLKKDLEGAGVECTLIDSPDNELDISSDCIIYAAGSAKDTYKSYKTKLDRFLRQRRNNILFLNLRPSNPLRLKKLPTTWLDCRFEGFDIPSVFVKTFFEVLKELLEEVNGENEEREVRVAEILTKTRERMISNQKGSQFNNLWRLAYILNGNPYTKLTRH
jgi:hypothetical protein